MATASVQVDASKLEAVLGRFENAGPVVDREGKAALDRSAIRVQNSAKQNLQSSGAIDTGGLLGSIAVDSPNAFSRAIGTNKTYGEVVEVGRDAGKPPPPPGSLLGWLARHNIPAEAEFAIARKIGVSGIPARPYLRPALEENEPAIQREFDLAADRAVAELTR